MGLALLALGRRARAVGALPSGACVPPILPHAPNATQEHFSAFCPSSSRDERYDGVRDQLGAAAGAAALFAVAQGDMRRVRDFYNGPPIDALVNLNVTG